jgi:L-fuconolactonase
MRPIVDSHIHFWQPGKLRYEWLANVPSIHRTYLPKDLARVAAAVNLCMVNFVQAECAPEDAMQEVAWVSKLAQTEPLVQGIVAFAPLEQGEVVAPYLERLKEFPLVRGVRRLIQDEEPGFAIDTDFVQGVQCLSQFEFSFDICILHPQMAEVILLVEQCPEISFVLDHFGKPGIKDQELEPWSTQMQTLAMFPNVSCKLSGLVTEADLNSWTPADLQPYIDQALAAFSPERIMFGGDWPVSELATTYQGWVETAESALNSLSKEEKDKIFYQNAVQFYRLKDQAKD